MDIVWRRLWAPDGRDPAWVSDGVTKRPALAPGRRHLVVHYTGVTSTTYVGKPTVSSAQAVFRSVQASKGDEYNYIVGADGMVLEWAGLNRAAHCTNWNTESIGVLFLLAVGETPPLEMAVALLNLRRHLVDVGALTPSHRVGQHREYLGTSPGPSWQPKTGNWQTDCCGAAVIARWPMYSAPLPPPDLPKPPQPVNPVEDVVFWKVTDHPEYNGLAVVFHETAPGVFVHIGPSDATRYATRAGTTADVWAGSQQPYPGGWAALKPKFFPRA